MRTAEFNRQFLNHKNGLHAYLRGFLKNSEDAADVLQDLYIRVWEKRKTINSESARFYFFSTARNLCIDFFRKKRNHVELDFEMMYQHSSLQDLEKQELSRLFREAIDKLPSGYREIIFLKDVCQMTTEEVIQMTGSDVNRMRVNLSRARKKVKDELEMLYRIEGAKRVQ